MDFGFHMALRSAPPIDSCAPRSWLQSRKKNGGSIGRQLDSWNGQVIQPKVEFKKG